MNTRADRSDAIAEHLAVSEYTPPTEVVKDAACFPREVRLGEPMPLDRVSFDRWLAAHDAELREAR